jgi:DNA invertase Pin-like site-specific DNA recombinase
MTDAPHTERLDGYVRVSQRNGRARDDEAFRSPDQQRETITRWAAAHGAEIVAWHEDLGESGSRMSRPGLNAALDRIRAGETNGVACAFLDRFTRASVGEAMTVLEEVNRLGGQIVAADVAGIRPDDPTGEFMLTSLIASKRLEWRQTAQRWDANRRDAIRDGKAIGGAPFGYRFADPTTRSGSDGLPRDSRLVPDDFAAPIVRELFERKAAGATWLELARWLDTAAPKPNGGHWSRNTVRGMIGRRTYLGEVSHGQHINATAHKPIVPAGLWRRAQGKPGRRTPRGTYLLSGVARCAGCGRRMRGSTLGRGGKRIYTCGTVKGDCSARSTVLVERLDAEVTEQFLSRRLADARATRVSDADLDAARERVVELTDAVTLHAQVTPRHQAAVSAHREALAALERELEDAEDRLEELISRAEQAGPDARELRRDWPDLPLVERRNILRAGIDSVLVRRAASRATRPPVAERIRILWHGEAPAGLVDNGRSGDIRSWTWSDDQGSSVEVV